MNSSGNIIRFNHGNGSGLATKCPYCETVFSISELLSGKTVHCNQCAMDFVVEAFEQISEFDMFTLWLSLYYGLITESTLEQCIHDYTQNMRMEKKRTLFELMIENGYIKEKDLKTLLLVQKNWALRQKEKEIAKFAVDQGFITENNAREALVDQAVSFRKNGTLLYVCDILHNKQKISKKQVEILVAHGALSILRHKTVQVSNKVTAEAPAASYDNMNKHQAQAFQEPSCTKSESIIPSVKKNTEPITKPKDLSEKENIQPATSVIAPEKQSVDAPVENKFVPPRKDGHNLSEPEKKEAVSETIQEESDVRIVNGIEITISEQRLDAWLRIVNLDVVKKLNPEKLKEILTNEGIEYGLVDDSLISGFINSRVFMEKKFRVAKGKPSDPGRNGDIRYFFETDYLTIGAVAEDGNIDFKNRGEIPFVNEGTLLAEITPEIKSQNGIDVYGMPVVVPHVREVKLFCEKGASFSDDKLKVFATIDGQPKVDFGNRISVLSELKIQGDVGYETGHIEFEGNIVVLGTIQSEFQVKGANISAKEILSADIEATGDVTVENGINGARINAHGNIAAKFISKARIKSYGHVVAGKQIIDSKIKTSGCCKVTKGKIISCDITALQGIDAMEIGSDLSQPCRFKVGINEHISEEINLIDCQIDQMNNKITEIKNKEEELKVEEKNIYKVIADLAYIQDTSQSKIRDAQQELEIEQKGKNSKSVIQAFENKIKTFEKEALDVDDQLNAAFDDQDALKDQLQETKDMLLGLSDDIWMLKQKKNDINELAKKIPHFPVVKSKGTIFAGTVVTGPNSVVVVKETLKNSIIKEMKIGEHENAWVMRIG